MNSVGFWTKSRKPSRMPDHDSTKWYRDNASKGSQYWYTSEGVYRRSDHWGSDVASCSWYIDGRRYRKDGVSKGSFETAFIKWSDLRPLGNIARHTIEEIENSQILQKIFQNLIKASVNL